MKLIIWTEVGGSNFSPFSIYQGIINNYSYVISCPKDKVWHEYKITKEQDYGEEFKKWDGSNPQFALSWEPVKDYEGYKIWNDGSYIPILEDPKTEMLYTVEEIWTEKDSPYRYNEDLIALVEKYGDLVGDGAKVVEIPDGIEYYIDQPEGCGEEVHEAHRVWR